MTTDTIQQLSLKEIHQRLRDGSLKSRELTESAIGRYREDLGAYRDFRKDDAVEHAILADQAFRCGTDLGPLQGCLLYTSPSPRDGLLSRMPSSA